jgi:5-methylcytosine-specific restriction endonuclease McrA
VRETVEQALEMYGRTCHLCGLHGATTVDHLIPVFHGGPVWDLTNMRPAHWSCNRRRGTMPLHEWFRRHPIGPAPVLPPSRQW